MAKSNSVFKRGDIVYASLGTIRVHVSSLVRDLVLWSVVTAITLYLRL